ncbi:hypothetical protein V2O82_04235, partial [Streptococcus pneumoniae]
KHPLGEKRNHPGSKLRQGFWMVFRFGVNNWGLNKKIMTKQGSNLLMLLKNLKLMSSYQKSYLQPQNST